MINLIVLIKSCNDYQKLFFFVNRTLRISQTKASPTFESHNCVGGDGRFFTKMKPTVALILLRRQTFCWTLAVFSSENEGRDVSLRRCFSSGRVTPD